MDKKDQKNLRLKNIQNTFIEVGGIVKELLARRAPPQVYKLWIRKKCHLFKLDMFMASHRLKVDELGFFKNIFDHSHEDIYNLLVKFYLHGLMLRKVTRLNPNLLIGDVHLRVLCSMMRNEMEREE